MWRLTYNSKAIGVSPSGKATDSDSVIRRFKSCYPSHTGGSSLGRQKIECTITLHSFFVFRDTHRRLVSTISICSNVEFRCAVTIATRVFTLSANIRHQVSITYSANNCPSRRSSSFGGNVDSYSSNPCGFCMQTK